jgi:hypothetical protein
VKSWEKKRAMKSWSMNRWSPLINWIHNFKNRKKNAKALKHKVMYSINQWTSSIHWSTLHCSFLFPTLHLSLLRWPFQALSKNQQTFSWIPKHLTPESCIHDLCQVSEDKVHCIIYLRLGGFASAVSTHCWCDLLHFQVGKLCYLSLFLGLFFV